MQCFKSVLARMALATLVLGIVACSNNDGGSQSNKPSPSSSSTPANSSSSAQSSEPKPDADVALLPVIAEAEGGASAVLSVQGADVSLVTDSEDSSIQYLTAAVNVTTAPEDINDSRVVLLDVTFPQPGAYQIYSRFRIGPNGSNDDSLYILAPPSPGVGERWALQNGVAGFSVAGEAGYNGEAIVGNLGGSGASGVWKWALFNDVVFEVPADDLVQTFAFATREDGLDIDKFAFALIGDGYTLGFTTDQLDAAEAGVLVYPPERPDPYTPPADQPPLAQTHDKFLGSVCCDRAPEVFANYFNQVVPENAGKWGSVEAVRDEYNWEPLDEIYQYALDNDFPFRFHVLLWGNQQPQWINELPAEEQLEEIREWFEAVAERYGAGIDFLEVINEFDNDPPSVDEPGGGNYIEALGGTGDTGFDWILTAFRMADEIFPETTQLMLNEYSVINSDARTDTYLDVVELLQQENLIDAIGAQAHAFSTRGPISQMLANVDRLANTGLPIYLTEFELDGPTELTQLIDFERVFLPLWENDGIAGITFWGYRPGLWRTAQGAYLVYEDGGEKLAMRWLKGYLRGTAPLIADVPAEVTVAADAALGSELATFSVTAPDGNAYPADAVIEWGVVDGSAAEAVEFDSGSNRLTLVAPLTQGSYEIRIFVDVNATLSALYSVSITVE